jgi:hypothetical protein
MRPSGPNTTPTTTNSMPIAIAIFLHDNMKAGTVSFLLFNKNG